MTSPSRSLVLPPDATSRRAVTALSIGHFSVDFFQGCVPVVVLHLVSERHYTYAAVGSLVFAFNSASSVIQPVFGRLADKRSMHWLMPFGLLLIGLATTLVGTLSSPALMYFVAMCGGIGVAAFHPEAARLVRQVSGARKATAMSWFSMGGSSGFAVGPLVSGAIFAWLGLERGCWFLLVPLALLLIYNLLELPFVNRLQQARKAAAAAASANAARQRDQWGAFGLLCLAITGRSIVFYGLSTFLAPFWLREAHGSETGGSWLVSLLFAFGVLGALLGGWCGDRFGHRRVVTASFLAMAPGVFLLPHLPAPVALVLGVAVMGMCLYLPYSVLVVLGQEYLPNHVGLASGVTLGLTITLGGLFTPVLGWFADHHGIGGMFTALAAVPLLAMVATAFLPQPGGQSVADESSASGQALSHRQAASAAAAK